MAKLRMKRFTSDGEWPIPNGVTRCLIWGRGGGAGGGKPPDQFTRTYGGGGAGMVCRMIGVTPGKRLGITIGLGGAGATTTSAVGANGGDTRIEFLDEMFFHAIYFKGAKGPMKAGLGANAGGFYDASSNGYRGTGRSARNYNGSDADFFDTTTGCGGGAGDGPGGNGNMFGPGGDGVDGGGGAAGYHDGTNAYNGGSGGDGEVVIMWVE